MTDSKQRNDRLKQNQPKSTSSESDSLVLPILGAGLSIVWMVLVALWFLDVVGYKLAAAETPLDLTENIERLVWPSLAAAVAVPAVVFLWIGGFRALARLRELKNHLKNLDTYVASFDDLKIASRDVNTDLQSAETAVTKASNAMSANLAKYEEIQQKLDKTFEKIGQEAISSDQIEHPIEDQETDEAVDKFYRAFYRANDIFYEVLEQRNESPGRGRRQLLVNQGGLNKTELTDNLHEEGRLNDRVHDILHRIFSMEKSTRWQGRSNLDSERVQQILNDIESLKPEDWV